MYKAKVNKSEYEIVFTDSANEKGQINGEEFHLDIVKNSNSFHILKGNYSYNINIISSDPEKKQVILEINKQKYSVKITDELDVLLKSMGLNKQSVVKNKDLKAPMPGLVTKIFVKKGDEIKKGDNLLVLEAMKMENNLKAENKATIKDIIIDQGKSVEKDEVLILFE